ncbi:helix-turn-helix transcriptional regulator [Paenibacillus chitinolyticus]
MSKADNMLAVLWHLKSGRKMTARELAETLEINIRTVYRYIDALCASGVPILADSGHNGGYSLLPNFREAPLFFNAAEQKALVHAAIFAEEAGYPFGEALNSAVGKLKQYTNPEQLSAIERHEAGFDVIHPPTDSSLEGYLQMLEIAVADGYTVRMEYSKGHAAPVQSRDVDPYGLVHWRSKWYLVAFCRLRDELRSFRVDRIRALSQTEDRFDRPQGFSARHFFMNNLLPDTSQEDQLVSVRISGSPESIAELCDHWLFGRAIVERTTNQVHMKMEEKAIRSYVPYFLMIHGRSIRILEPPLLKEQLISATSGLLEFYKQL